MQPLSVSSPIANNNLTKPSNFTSSTSNISFTEFLQKAIQEVDVSQKEADQAAIGLATGEINDVHQAVIAAEKAALALQLTIQVRNKVLDAYQEIMRMQI